jgi:hypothetical protein
MTGNESWIYGYDPEPKQKTSQWKSSQSPRAKRVWQIWSSTESMLIILFNVKGIVHHEFVPPNTLERKFATQTLMQPQLAHSYDNAPRQTSLKTTQFVTNNYMVIVPHHHYLLDLDPCDFAVSQIENETERMML